MVAADAFTASDPQQRFVLVRLLADGAVVKAEQGEQPELVAVDHADDDAMWTRTGERLVHALTGRELRVEPEQGGGSLEPAACGDGECVGLLDAGGRRVTVSGETSFVLQRGPERLPTWWLFVLGSWCDPNHRFLLSSSLVFLYRSH